MSEPTVRLLAYRMGRFPARRGRTEPAPGWLGPDLPGAACGGQVPVLGPLWDGQLDNEAATARAQRHQRAIEICRGCPVQVRCMDARLVTPQLGDGVYGGRVFDSTRRCRCGSPMPEGAGPRWRWCSQRCRRGLRKATARQGQCLVCGVGFMTTQPRKRFCSARCQRRAGKHGREPSSGLTRCQWCDTPLAPEQSARGARNCSQRCRNRASDQRITAANRKEVAA